MIDRGEMQVLKKLLKIYKSSPVPESFVDLKGAGQRDPDTAAQWNRVGVSSLYELGPFRLDPGAGVLTRAGDPTPLGSRGVAVLTALVERRNEYVPKSRIIDAAWPDLVVEEGNLAVQISAIRRVLAQAPGGERWVETLARRGYRFVGPVLEPLRHKAARL